MLSKQSGSRPNIAQTLDNPESGFCTCDCTIGKPSPSVGVFLGISNVSIGPSAERGGSTGGIGRQSGIMVTGVTDLVSGSPRRLWNWLEDSSPGGFEKGCAGKGGVLIVASEERKFSPRAATGSK